MPEQDLFQASLVASGSSLACGSLTPIFPWCPPRVHVCVHISTPVILEKEPTLPRYDLTRTSVTMLFPYEVTGSELQHRHLWGHNSIHHRRVSHLEFWSTVHVLHVHAAHLHWRLVFFLSQHPAGWGGQGHFFQCKRQGWQLNGCGSDSPLYTPLLPGLLPSCDPRGQG